MIDPKFEFIIKGLPFSSDDSRFNWHKRYVWLSSMISRSANDISGFDYLGEVVAFRQYTGLKDRNGVEIYDGDIVISGMTGAIYLIFWSEELFGWYKKPVNTDSNNRPIYQDESSSRVIGNIYQNPELLESQK